MLPDVHLEMRVPGQLLAGAYCEALFPSSLPFLEALLDALLSNTSSSGRLLGVSLQQYWGPGNKFQT